MENILLVANVHQRGGARKKKANTSSSTSKKKKKQPIKVVYISNPMKFNTSATEFRSLVQQLTGQDSDPTKFLDPEFDDVGHHLMPPDQTASLDNISGSKIYGDDDDIDVHHEVFSLDPTTSSTAAESHDPPPPLPPLLLADDQPFDEYDDAFMPPHHHQMFENNFNILSAGCLFSDFFSCGFAQRS